MLCLFHAATEYTRVARESDQTLEEYEAAINVAKNELAASAHRFARDDLTCDRCDRCMRSLIEPSTAPAE